MVPFALKEGQNMIWASTSSKNSPSSMCPPDVEPYYRPTLLIAAAASAAVVMGSLGSWVHVLLFNVDGLDFANWGVATLTLGAVCCVALLTLLSWSRTPFDEPRAVALACITNRNRVILVAGIVSGRLVLLAFRTGRLPMVEAMAAGSPPRVLIPS
jgi:hypothetical protein